MCSYAYIRIVKYAIRLKLLLKLTTRGHILYAPFNSTLSVNESERLKIINAYLREQEIIIPSGVITWKSL